MDKTQDRHTADWTAPPPPFEPGKDFAKGGFVGPAVAPTTYSSFPVIQPSTEEPLTEDPLAGPDIVVKAILALALPLLYIVATFFLAVEWLNFGHPELQTPVVAAFGGLGGWAAAAVFHYIGATNTARSLVTGTWVTSAPLESYRRMRMRIS